MGFGCTDPSDSNFNSIYYNYLEDTRAMFNPIIYNIFVNNGVRFLEFTNANGDKALYANQFLGISEQNLIAIEVYPNPASNIVSIKSVVPIQSIKLINSIGQEATNVSMNINKDELYISNLATGLYFLNIATVDGVIVKRIIKY
jgi:hypothetical protein